MCGNSGTRPCLSLPPEIKTPRAPFEARSAHRSKSEPLCRRRSAMPCSTFVLQCSQLNAQAVPVTLIEANSIAFCVSNSSVLYRRNPGAWNVIASPKFARRISRHSVVTWADSATWINSGIRASGINVTAVWICARLTLRYAGACHCLRYRFNHDLGLDSVKFLSPALKDFFNCRRNFFGLTCMPSQRRFQICNRIFRRKKISADKNCFDGSARGSHTHIDQPRRRFDLCRAIAVRHSSCLIHPIFAEIFLLFQYRNLFTLVEREIGHGKIYIESGNKSSRDHAPHFIETNFAFSFSSDRRNATCNRIDVFVR